MTGRLRPTAPLGRDRGGEDGQDQRDHQAVQERDLRDHVSLMGMDDGDEGEDCVDLMHTYSKAEQDFLKSYFFRN